MSSWQAQLKATIDPVVRRSKTVDAIVVGSGVLDQVAPLLTAHFGATKAVLVADDKGFEAAGQRVDAILARAGIAVTRHIFPAEPRLKASVENASAIVEAVRRTGGLPVAVGSGVINDLVKYAAFQLDQPFFCVATAASMDGYASAGAPLSDRGFKHTIPCAPPRVMLADLDVLSKAPAEMSGWGYGDMAGKIPAGADWIVADALGIEAIDDVAWPLVQNNLRDWLSAPAAVAAGDPQAMAFLFAGLVVSGLAMEFHGSSRPASGADHQIAHLWEMEDVAFGGVPVSHGACVALGTLTVVSLYDWLLAQDLSGIDARTIVGNRASLAAEEAEIRRRFGKGAIAERSIVEIRAKYPNDDTLLARIDHIKAIWPALRARLTEFLVPMPALRSMLRKAGVVTDPLQVGIGRAHHKNSVLSARFIRQRYTILDLLNDLGLLDSAIDSCFGPDGVWSPADAPLRQAAGGP